MAVALLFMKIRAITLFEPKNGFIKQAGKIFQDVRTWRTVGNRSRSIWNCVVFREPDNKKALALIKKKVFVHYLASPSDKDFIEQAAKLMFVLEPIDNFKFGISFDCPEYSPFFPYSYGDSGFSIGPEIIPQLHDENLIQELKDIESRALKLEAESDVEYRGMDLSLTPFPTGDSVVSAIGGRFGAAGTVFSAAKITTMLKSLPVKKCGFNGIFYSVAEDPLLSKCEPDLNLLLALSTVCGAGLDMIPVRATREVVVRLIKDVAALSFKVRKGLGVRMMPTKESGKWMDLDHSFLCKARIYELA